MSSRCFWHGVLVLAVLFAGPLGGQQQAHVSGIIRDQSGGAVIDAAITVVSHDTGFRRNAVSSAEGWYAVATLQPGLYNVTVRKEGFRTLIRYGVKLDVAQAARVDFELEIGSVQEVITVTGPAPVVNTEDASVGTLVTRERIERLPLNGRGLLSLVGKRRETERVVCESFVSERPVGLPGLSTCFAAAILRARNSASKYVNKHI